MEFLLVGESKLKIIMSGEEMARYKLDTEDSGTAAQRRAFWRVLEMAKAEVGFDPAGDKVLIQFYPTRPDGCEVFVTKLGVLSGSSARLVSRSDKVAMLSKKQSLYSFDTLDGLIGAARAVKLRTDALPHADVYLGDDGNYFLSLEEYTKGGEPVEFPCILEFARELTADFSVFVKEHYTRLADGDGIEFFSSL